MLDPQEDVELFVCQCHHLNHIARLMYFKDDKDCLYVEMALNNHLGLFKRIKNGLKYIFGGKICGAIDCIILDKPDAIRMRDCLSRFVE